MISAIKDVKEHNEGVKSQIKEIREDINKFGNDSFNVEVKLEARAVRATRLSRNNRYSSGTLMTAQRYW